MVCGAEGEESEDPSFNIYGEPDGEAFAVLPEMIKNGDVPGYSPVHLPETIDGAALATMLLMPDGATVSTFIRYAFPAVTTALGVISAQAYITWIVSSDLVPEDGTCEDGDTALRAIVLAVFLMVMLNDLKDVWNILRWMQRLPHAPRHQWMQMQKFKDRNLDEEDKEFFDDELNVTKVVSGITSCELVIGYAMLIPKAVVLLCLAYFGSGYLLRSPDNESLIMNSVALCFVMEISEYCFKYVTNNNIAYILDSLPPVGLSAQEVQADMWSRLEDLWPMFSFLVLGVLTALLWYSWC